MPKSHEPATLAHLYDQLNARRARKACIYSVLFGVLSIVGSALFVYCLLTPQP